MLRIKEGIDLKELEKFGFRPKYDEDTGEITAYIIERKCEGLFIKKEIPLKRFRIYKLKANYWKINPYDSNYFDVDTLYDLIQAGLVEKI